MMNLSGGFKFGRRPSASESVLLEEWPQRKVASTNNHNQDGSHKGPKVAKSVSFSDLSRRRQYTIDPSYEAAKSYTSRDRKIFRKQAAVEVFRIKYLIESCPMRTGPAIQQLLKNKVLTCEDLLGIEHCVNKKPHQAPLDRRFYMEAVMKTQQQIQKSGDNSDGAEILASVAAVMSTKSVKQARMRALLAIGRV